RGRWPRPLEVVADVLHVGAAAVWIGGLLALAVALPRASRRLSQDQRPLFAAALVPKLSALALVSVLVIAATGLIRALSELSAVSQLWSTGYGRALVVKTVLLVAVVALGWVNRSRLVPRLRLGALRRNVAAELILLAGIVTAVAFLTDLAPGRQLARALARPQARRPIAAPPPGATVLAGESGDRAVGLAVLPGGGLQATVLGPDDNGVDGLSVGIRVGGRALGWTRVGGRRARLVSFFDPRLPGWYELAMDPRTHRPLELKMTAAAHFMHHRYTDFNRPIRIGPPR